MPRYSGWRRLSGETADRPDLLDLGKRLLGYLSEQRALSGNTTMSIERKTADGSIVRARFVGDIPCIEVQAVEPSSGGEIVLSQGIVAHPRSFADGAAFDDADTLLIPFGGKTAQADHRDWMSLFHTLPDPAPFPRVGIYTETLRGDPLFPNLALGGNVDWRNATERLAVTWDGPGSRYFNVGRSYGGPNVYHNGVLLLDVQEIPELVSDDSLDPSGIGVNGACLRRGEGGWWLYVMVNHASGSLPSILWMYRVPLVADTESVPWFKRVTDLPADIAPPLFLTADLTKVERIATQHYDYQDTQAYFGLCPFNQSGTECRTLVYENRDGSFGDPIRVVELVFDARDPDNVSIQRIDHGVLTESESTLETYGPARLSARVLGASSGTPSFTALAYVAPGYLVPLSATYGNTLSPSQPDYPCAVDYRDDVPVYAYASTELATESRSYSAQQSQVTSAALTPWTMTASCQSREVRNREDRIAALSCRDADGEWLALERRLDTTTEINNSFDDSYQSVPATFGTLTTSGNLSSTIVATRTAFTIYALDLRFRTALYAVSTGVTTTTANHAPEVYTQDGPTTSASYRLGGTDATEATAESATTVVVNDVSAETWSGVRTIDPVSSAGFGPPLVYRIESPQLSRTLNRAADYDKGEAVLPGIFSVGHVNDYPNGTLDDIEVSPDPFNYDITRVPTLPHTAFDAMANSADSCIRMMTDGWPRTLLQVPSVSRTGSFCRINHRYVYAIASLEGDTDEPKWRSRTDSNVRSFDIQTGGLGAEAFQPLWLTSAFPYPR